jgi:hypothetical protein
MVNEQQLEKAMLYLAQTDAEYAAEKAELLKCEILCKRVRARIYVTVDGAVEQRKAQAETHPEVIAADDALVTTTQKFETLKARRQRAEIVIEVWRSLEASRRKAA